jgi:hypothetical protein
MITNMDFFQCEIYLFGFPKVSYFYRKSEKCGTVSSNMIAILNLLNRNKKNNYNCHCFKAFRAAYRYDAMQHSINPPKCGNNVFPQF